MTAIVRSADRLPAGATGHKLLTVVVVPGGHLTLSDEAMAGHMRGEEDGTRSGGALRAMRHELFSRYLASTPAGCDAVISALGHNLTLWGMYGAPRKLCTDTVSQLCRVAEMLQPARPIRLIAISTEGARARASHSASNGRTACTACTACTAGPAQASQAQAS